MIWICPVDNCINEDLSFLKDLLSPTRYQRMMQYCFNKDRNLCMLSFILIRFALYQEYHISDIPNIVLSNNKKPVFENLSLHFNISHCERGILCALDSTPVGVDIQNGEVLFSDVLEDVLTKNERAIVKRNSKEFWRFWTLKEAYGKYHGKGICYDLTHTDFSSIYNQRTWQTFEEKNVISWLEQYFAVSVFANHPMKINKIDLSDLFRFKNIMKNKNVLLHLNY